ncbi:MAG: hypothetical protein CMJ78_15975 [Planctomycetaceae bacterium]|nr:hypothetical protein [Planctomycetaceae bacterium]
MKLPSMAKKKTSTRKTTKKKATKKRPQIRSFSALLKGRSADVQTLAKALRALILDELADAEETFYTAANGMAIYRLGADVCWLQPLKTRCNLYFLRGTELDDKDGLLEGGSDRFRHVKVDSIEALDELPLREWIRQSVELNEATLSGALSFDEVLERLREVCLALPNTKETLTWGKPYFRVGEKIFCGCAEIHGRASLGLKMDTDDSYLMMQLPGIEKAAYSRSNDGWVSIDPAEFDDWAEIEQLIVGSFRLIAPKRTLAMLDD